MESLQDRRRAGSLIELLDETRTSMGGRLLRRWLLFPSVELATIRRRHDAVERLVGAHAARDRARKQLDGIADIERLVGRARLGVATPRDLAVLGRSLTALPALAEALAEAHAGELGGSLAGEADLLRLRDDDGDDDQALAAELAAELTRVLRPDAPALTKDGGYVNAGVSAELDELVDIASGGRSRIAAIEARERERTGIPSLKIKFNNVFGYYIEVTRSNLGAVPADYRRKQTVANAERFVTTELGGVRGDGPLGRRAADRDGAGALHGAARAGRRRGGAAAGARRARRRRRHAGSAGRGGAPQRLLPADWSTTAA